MAASEAVCPKHAEDMEADGCVVCDLEAAYERAETAEHSRDTFRARAAMAERAEAEAAVMRKGLKMFEHSSMGGGKPTQGESWIGWQRGDGPTANERQKMAREALELNAGRALLERVERMEKALQSIRDIELPSTDDPDVGYFNFVASAQQWQIAAENMQEAARKALPENDHG